MYQLQRKTFLPKLQCYKIVSIKVDNATDNHNDNAIFTDEDSNIINIVADLLGVETEKLKQVERKRRFKITLIFILICLYYKVALARQINISGNVTEIPFKLQEARENRLVLTRKLELYTVN